MKIFEKGTQVHATELLYVKGTKLYTDEATSVELKQAAAENLAANPSKIFISDGTTLTAISAIKIDGSQITVGEKSYSIAAD